MKDEYLGKYVSGSIDTPKRLRKKASHPIFLYHPDVNDKEQFKCLQQIVNVYEHTEADFEVNGLRIIDHYAKSYGLLGYGMYTIGQSIMFRVEKGGKEFGLPLFQFFINYAMLAIPILAGDDMSDWEPWTPISWTPGGWEARINYYVERVRDKINIRRCGELIQIAKYLGNMFAHHAGNRMAYSISNNDFIALTERSKDAYESITCTFDIPEDISPSELEKMTMDRTRKLLKFIEDQKDLPISVYVKNGLFNPTQFREFAVHICQKPDLNGNTIPFTHNTNIIMGTSHPKAFVVDASGGRKAEITKLNVSDAGTLERAMSMLMSTMKCVDTEYECDSKHFRIVGIANADMLKKLEGRVCTLDPDSDEYLIIDPHNTDLIGETIYVKTPITCTHPRRHEGYICSACYGKLMSSINCDIHIGRIAALESADDMEQTLLSAKHALNTNTSDIEFSEEFYEYFSLGNSQIGFNDDIITLSESSDISHLYLEFYPNSMEKKQDGEGRHFDRCIDSIVVYNSKDDSHTTIRELNGIKIYLSPEFVTEYYIPASQYRDDNIVRVPFSDMLDTGEVVCDVIFEFFYKNTELASALLTLQSILFKGDAINSFDNFNDCLRTIIPLFIKGGIHIPDYQAEMLISQMIFTEDNKPVDWNEPNPKYKFCSIPKSIQNGTSVLTSLLYHDTANQIAGAHGAYEKTGTSSYDYFLVERK